MFGQKFSGSNRSPPKGRVGRHLGSLVPWELRVAVMEWKRGDSLMFSLYMVRHQRPSNYPRKDGGNGEGGGAGLTSVTFILKPHLFLALFLHPYREVAKRVTFRCSHHQTKWELWQENILHR